MTQKKTSALLLRQRAVSACLTRFEGVPLIWGKTDCVRLCALALRKQGHAVPLLKGVRYSSEQTALRRFKEQKIETLCDAVDALGLVRIAPAMALPGDLIAMPPGEGNPFGAALGVIHTAASRRIIAASDDTLEFRVLAPDLSQALCVWRV